MCIKFMFKAIAWVSEDLGICGITSPCGIPFILLNVSFLICNLGIIIPVQLAPKSLGRGSSRNSCLEDHILILRD